MKSDVVHWRYATGILLALLIGSISVKWNGIKDLAGIVSFALGFSSLILSLIAIVQTLSSSQAAVDTSVTIRHAVGEIVPAADSIRATSEQLVGQLRDLRLEYQTGSERVARMDEKLDRIGRNDFNQSQSSSSLLPGKMTNGAVPAVLAVACSLKFNKEFSFSEIFEGQSLYNIAYKDGVIGILLASGIIDRNTTGNQTFRVIESKLDADLVIQTFSQATKIPPENDIQKDVLAVATFFAIPDFGQRSHDL